MSAPLGAAVGLEREISGQRAGLRTHLLVGLGACIFTEASAFGFAYLESRPSQTALDPSRIAAQVVSGIGFLGAGAILRYGINVRGLTTAASLWVVAALGLATALGLYAAAALAVAITILALVGLRPVRSRLRQRRRSNRAELSVDADQTLDLGALARPLADARVRIDNIRIQERENEEARQVVLLVNLGRADLGKEELLARVAAVSGVHEAEWRR